MTSVLSLTTTGAAQRILKSAKSEKINTKKCAVSIAAKTKDYGDRHEEA